MNWQNTSKTSLFIQIKIIMNTNKVWLITGAGRGMGLDFAKAALAEGYNVVATGRNTEKVSKAIDKADNLLVVKPGCYQFIKC
jgi:NAD(P)-dependent dehydrogenase (short-subunit alcohol dehydrogenase family)